MLAKVKGGVESMALNYHRAMVAAGHEVLSLGHPEGVLATQLAPAEFRHLTARFDLDPGAAWRLMQYAQAYRPDLILTHGNRAGGLAQLPCIGAGRTVQVMHNLFLKRHNGCSKALLAVSQSVLEGVRKAYPNVPVLSQPNFSSLQIAPVKPKPKGVPVIGVLGRLHEQKGFDLWLEALKILKSRGGAFTAQMAGDGPDRELLSGLIKAYDLDVDMPGWVDDITGYLSGLDLFVMPSRYEPFGLTLIEAMAAGVAVIAADIEGPLEITQGGQFGRLFAAKNVEAMADSMEAALKDWRGNISMAKRAQSHILALYGFEAGVHRLDENLKAIVALKT